MILCVEEAHKLNWIHRDVKPDNFLITASGHLKISDFGLAFDGHKLHAQSYFQHHRHSLLETLGIEVEGDTIDRNQGRTIINSLQQGNLHLNGASYLPNVRVIGGKTPYLPPATVFTNRRLAHSTVGTPQYMAPEVLHGGYYDGRCDWWSIGIIMYECLFGHTPFCADTSEGTKKRILNHTTLLHFPNPSHVSWPAVDLICALLQDAPFRLCTQKYTQYAKEAGFFVYPDDAEDIKRHYFFRNIDWDKLHLNTPPWVPSVSPKDPAAYFDAEVDILGSLDEGMQGRSNHEALYPERGAGDGIQDDAATVLNIEDWFGGNAMAERPADGQDQNEMASAMATAAAKGKARPAKKPAPRARDKLLRDPQTREVVMACRKRNAFLGYTYRRPPV